MARLSPGRKDAAFTGPSRISPQQRRKSGTAHYHIIWIGRPTDGSPRTNELAAKRPSPGGAGSHVRIVRPAAAFRRHPDDILVRVLDVAGFAVDAVLRVDLEARARRFLDPFIDAGRTITAGGPRIDVMLGLLLQRHVLHDEVDRLILLVIGVRQEHRRELV